MPRFEFRHSPTESIPWTFNREPAVGEEVALGDRGVFVLGPSTMPPLDPNAVVLKCVYVREVTPEELRAILKRGVNTLPKPE